MLDGTEGARSLDDLLADESAAGWLQSGPSADGPTEPRWTGGTAALPRPVAPPLAPRRRPRVPRPQPSPAKAKPQPPRIEPAPAEAPLPVVAAPRVRVRRYPRIVVKNRAAAFKGLALLACAVVCFAALSQAPSRPAAPAAPALRTTAWAQGIGAAVERAASDLARRAAATERRARAAERARVRRAAARRRAHNRAKARSERRAKAAAAARARPAVAVVRPAAPAPQSAPAPRAAAPSYSPPRSRTETPLCELGPC